MRRRETQTKRRQGKNRKGEEFKWKCIRTLQTGGGRQQDK